MNPLSDAHLAMLHASAINDDVIGERGYATITAAAQLKKLGFGDRQCRVPALLLPVHGVRAGIVNFQIRPDAPRVIKDKIVKYETPSGTRMVMDAHPSVRHYLGDPNIPLFITEGIKKGDALVSKGCCAIALLGVWNWRGTNEYGGKTALGDWECVALNGRTVYVVFDSDVMTNAAVHAALGRLKTFLQSRDAHVYLIYLPAGPHGEKVGVDDALASGMTIRDVTDLATDKLRAAASAEGASDGDVELDASQADALVTLGRQCELFHNETDVAFARIPFGDHRETWTLKSQRFDGWLRREYHRRTGRAPGSEALKAACAVLQAMARYDGELHEVGTRVRRDDHAIWYDLADARWRTVRIDADGWRVVDDPPTLFRRYAHQRPQVEPVSGGDVRRVLRYLNVQHDDELLLLVWLVAAFVPDIRHPTPEFHGKKGAGKSVGQRVLRRLIDPSAVEVLTFPSDVKELVQQLAHHYAPIYDNVDNLAPWLSDVLCRAVTGEGFTKRELYSDDDDIIYSYRRVIMLNGINVVARRPDLLDRSILLGLERIDRARRLEEREFWASFATDLPGILGGIFDTLSTALRVYPQLRPRALERMADFTRFGAAVAVALGYSADDFLEAYSKNLSVQTAEAVEGHIVGSALLELMRDQDEWRGTPSELLSALELAGEEAHLFRRSANGKVDAKSWPGAPHILTRRLNEVRSNLADLGITIDSSRDDQRTIVIRRTLRRPEDSDGSDGSDGKERDCRDSTDAADATDATFEQEATDWEVSIR